MSGGNEQSENKTINNNNNGDGMKRATLGRYVPSASGESFQLRVEMRRRKRLPGTGSGKWWPKVVSACSPRRSIEPLVCVIFQGCSGLEAPPEHEPGSCLWLFSAFRGEPASGEEGGGRIK